MSRGPACGRATRRVGRRTSQRCGHPTTTHTPWHAGAKDLIKDANPHLKTASREMKGVAGETGEFFKVLREELSKDAAKVSKIADKASNPRGGGR